MLISRESLQFDYKGAKFDLDSQSDRDLLGWIFNQFLYGEVTGIQCGYWLYRAPHLQAATFLARQASEELSHVQRILKILEVLGQPAEDAHSGVKRLSTGMMGASWIEHVAIEMALGEGLVLTVFYALADTIPHPEIHKLIESAIVDEQKHVEFGERETQQALQTRPGDRRVLLPAAIVQIETMKRIKGFLMKRLLKDHRKDHPVLSQLPAFYDHTVQKLEERVLKLGISDEPISKMSWVQKLFLLAQYPVIKIFRKIFMREPLLTSTYLKDPWLQTRNEKSL